MNTSQFLRRFNNMLSRGKLEKITDDKTPTAKINLMADELYDGLEFPQTWGFASRPPTGSEVIAAFFGGNRDHGTILTAFDKNTFPSELEDGDVMIWNGTNSIVKIKANGDILIAACKDPADNQDDLGRDLHEPQARITLTKAGVVEIEAEVSISATVGTTTVVIDTNSVEIEAATEVKLSSDTKITLDAPQIDCGGNLNVTTINSASYPP